MGASLAVTFLPDFKLIYAGVVNVSKIGLTVTLFLIGAGLSRETLRAVGIKPAIQGVILWGLISVVSLLAASSII